MNWKLSLLLLLFLPFSVQAKSVFLQIRDFNFNPNFIEIEQGDTVIWTNQGNMPHTVEGDSFSSGTIDPDATYEFTFNDTGNFDYVCGLHPSMTGRISVLPASEEAILDGNDESLIEEDEPEESLSEFFEVNNPPPAEEPSFSSPTQEPSMESETHQMGEAHMNHSVPDNATLSTSGGHWVYAAIFGLVGAVLFLGFRKS